MRHHFHQCPDLRLLTAEAGVLFGDRRERTILEELCAAKDWSRCVGLVECDVLSPLQKRALLGARATRLREEDPLSVRLLAGIAHDGAMAPADLREAHLDKREEIVLENRRLEAEIKALEGVLGREEITDEVGRAESGIDSGDARERMVLENRRLEAEIKALEGVLGREAITDEGGQASVESGIDSEDARERLTVRRLDSMD